MTPPMKVTPANPVIVLDNGTILLETEHPDFEKLSDFFWRGLQSCSRHQTFCTPTESRHRRSIRPCPVACR